MERNRLGKGFVEGTVIKVVGRRGYGFIRLHGSDKEFYFKLDRRCHISLRHETYRFADVIKRPRYPKVGDQVVFRMNHKAQKPRATVWGIIPDDCPNYPKKKNRSRSQQPSRWRKPESPSPPRPRVGAGDTFSRSK